MNITERWNRWGYRVIQVLILLVILGAGCSAVNAELPKQQSAKVDIWGPACFHVSNRPMRILETRHDRDMQYQLYDRDGDGVPDMGVYYRIVNGKVNPIPDFYLLDNDRDGEPETKVIDVNGYGNCEDMREIPIVGEKEVKLYDKG